VTREIRRLQLIQVVFILAFVGLVARAAHIQLVRGAEHRAAAEANRTAWKELPARRGTIYDRRGNPLVLSQELFEVGVAPNELRHADSAARRLATHLGIPVRTVRSRLRNDWAYLGSGYTSTQVQPLREVHGVHIESSWRRGYPLGGLARGFLGSPGLDGRPASGVEAVFDSVLTGRPGEAVVLKDVRGREFDSPSRLGSLPVPGHDVYLTIDADLQEIIEQALDDAVEQYRATGGDIVAIDPRTGEVLAVASRGESATGAVGAAFEPGSTAKLFAAAALLTHGLVAPDDTVWTNLGRLEFEHRVIRDDHPNGWLTLRGVIQQSSNIGIVLFSERLSPEQHFTMLRDFGLGTYTGIEFPGESRGRIPRPEAWSGTTASALAMGYEMQVTALQLALAYAAIANDGVLLQPTFVREIRTPDGKATYRHEPRPVRRVVTPDVAIALRGMLRAVVLPGGTGETAALTSYEVAGKTGTARLAGPAGYIPGAHRSSFVSVFPADDPQLVIAVKLDDPEGTYARATAAPVTKKVLQQILAGRTGALDRTRLTVGRIEPATVEPTAREELPVWVTPWPAEARGATPEEARAVPDVEGRTLRDAAKVLHAAGFRVRVSGWGVVQRTEPAAGARAARGSLVVVRAASSR
jgi:cell division protein FtsI (penicillin-binding protein 3)